MEFIWECDLSKIGRYHDKIRSRRQKKEIYSRGALKGRYAIISGDKVFCNAGRSVICINVKNGDSLWKGEAIGDPVHMGNRLFSYDNIGTFYCLNANSGELLFKAHLTDIYCQNASMPFLTCETFFIGTNKILAIDVNDGSILWEYQSEKKGSFFFDPVYIDGHLYTGCSDGSLYCFSRELGSYICFKIPLNKQKT